METGAPSNNMMQQAQHIWSMLDEMAESDPDGYLKFLKENLGKGVTETAKPWMCVWTRISEPQKEGVYINICSWNRIPKPKTDTDPISVSAGQVVEGMDKTGPYKVVQVAFNPDVLQECSKNAEEQDMLIVLALKYLREQKGMSLSPDFRICKKLKFKGDPKVLQDFFGTQQDTSADDLMKMTPVSLLSQLRGCSNPSETDSQEDLGLNGSFEPTKPKSNLIEEILSTNANLDSPKYDVSIRNANARQSRRIIVKVSLPDVMSVKDCELDIAEEELSLVVVDKYELHLSLTEPVLEDDSVAKFNSTTSSLTVSMPTKLQSELM